MDIRQFRFELAESFKAAGFERKRIKGSKATVWLLPGREVERAFAENAMRRPWGFLLGGVLAIDVPAFRFWLSNRFPRDRHGILRGSILSHHIANDPNMFFAVENEPPPYEQWVGLIRSRLASLPDTVDGLLAAEHQPERLKYLWDDYLAPRAWSYFKDWAKGAAPTNPPPFCLPNGQIVDVAANDAP